MKTKHAIAGLLSVTLVSLSTTSMFAANTLDPRPISADATIPISLELEQADRVAFGSFTGFVKDISDYATIEGSKIISVESEDGAEAKFIISKDTYITGDAEISLGTELTGFYDANAPMIMIYPPQYSMEVIVVGNPAQNIKVDRFDEHLLSSDDSLKLFVGTDTEILLQDGDSFAGDLTNRKLVVYYGISTKSLPAQTTPTKIVVLFEKASTLPSFPSEELLPIPRDISSMDILVNQNTIAAPAAYNNDQGTIMVPLRAIATSLGFDVKWNRELQSITLDHMISLRPGEDYYTYARIAPIQLGTAPELIDGTTFVPLNFFSEVARINSINLLDSQIVIDRNEPIESYQ